jgi:hypothetical protein
MDGDERVRYCADCALHVYNLSAMTAPEAEELVVHKEGHLCVRFYQREDGTMMTRDCPRGLIALRRAARRTPLIIGAFVAAMFLLLFGLVAGAVGLSDGSSTQSPFKVINGWLGGSPGTPTMGEPAPLTSDKDDRKCPVENQKPHAPERANDAPAQ